MTRPPFRAIINATKKVAFRGACRARRRVRMRLSSKSQYGLKACYILALHYPERCVSASALEKEIAVSGKYIEKIMRMLAGKGIVAAERGVPRNEIYKLTL